MKTIAKNFILLLSLLFIAVSCDNDESTSYEVKYEVIGNFSGNVDARTTSNGVTEYTIAKLPYTEEFKIYSTNTLKKAVVLSGTGGKAGEKVVVKIYVDGVVKKELTAITDSEGRITGTAETELVF
jgi:hypothetical protein